MKELLETHCTTVSLSFRSKRFPSAELYDHKLEARPEGGIGSSGQRLSRPWRFDQAIPEGMTARPSAARRPLDLLMGDQRVFEELSPRLLQKLYLFNLAVLVCHEPWVPPLFFIIAPRSPMVP
jgi:hypothetical protein